MYYMSYVLYVLYILYVLIIFNYMYLYLIVLKSKIHISKVKIHLRKVINPCRQKMTKNPRSSKYNQFVFIYLIIINYIYYNYL